MWEKAFPKRKHLCGKQRFKKRTAVGGRVKRLVVNPRRLRQPAFYKTAGFAKA